VKPWECCQDGPDDEDAAEGLFDSTVDIKGLIRSEDLLWRLAPPQWPEEVLGKIDQDKAARGALVQGKLL
jgi:hypothetical protein